MEVGRQLVNREPQTKLSPVANSKSIAVVHNPVKREIGLPCPQRVELQQGQRARLRNASFRIFPRANDVNVYVLSGEQDSRNASVKQVIVLAVHALEVWLCCCLDALQIGLHDYTLAAPCLRLQIGSDRQGSPKDDIHLPLGNVFVLTSNSGQFSRWPVILAKLVFNRLHAVLCSLACRTA